jgi:predicted N-acyltransferase
LLARDMQSRRALVKGLRQWALESGLSSAHLLFMVEDDLQALSAEGWLLREGVQFHWTQDAAQPVDSLDGLLQRMQRHKRKNIVQERRKVSEAGVSFTVHEGTAIDEGLWDFFYACYCQTYAAHHSSPYLTRDFFHRMARHMPEHWVMFVARRQGVAIAASLIAVDRARQWAWGRYWGTTEALPCLHFEACYYQPLQWCMANGFLRFEGGAQGEHQMARGLLPVNSFWSLSLYEATPEGQFYFTDNPLNRYAIGDRTAGLTHNADGSLDIWIGNVSPGLERETNWLPAPAGPFALFLRAYLPRTELLTGSYRVPALKEV